MSLGGDHTVWMCMCVVAHIGLLLTEYRNASDARINNFHQLSFDLLL